MPLTALDRIARDRAAPRIVELHFALTALRSVVSFLQSGAHPDDETSAMLAALRFRDGLSIAYVCSTRGEGGQNDIGTETGRRPRRRPHRRDGARGGTAGHAALVAVDRRGRSRA